MWDLSSCLVYRIWTLVLVLIFRLHFQHIEFDRRANLGGRYPYFRWCLPSWAGGGPCYDQADQRPWSDHMTKIPPVIHLVQVLWLLHPTSRVGLFEYPYFLWNHAGGDLEVHAPPDGALLRCLPVAPILCPHDLTLTKVYNFWRRPGFSFCATSQLWSSSRPLVYCLTVVPCCITLPEVRIRYQLLLPGHPLGVRPVHPRSPYWPFLFLLQRILE